MLLWAVRVQHRDVHHEKLVDAEQLELAALWGTCWWREPDSGSVALHNVLRPAHGLRQGPLLHLRRLGGRLRQGRGHGDDLRGVGRRLVHGPPGGGHHRQPPQPGRPERQHDGAQRSGAADVHQSFVAGGRHQAPRRHDLGVPRNRHSFGRPHRDRLPAGRAGDGHQGRSERVHQLEEQLGPPGGQRRHNRLDQVYPYGQVRCISTQCALADSQPALGHHRLAGVVRERGRRRAGQRRHLRRVLLRRLGNERALRGLGQVRSRPECCLEARPVADGEARPNQGGLSHQHGPHRLPHGGTRSSAGATWNARREGPDAGRRAQRRARLVRRLQLRLQRIVQVPQAGFGRSRGAAGTGRCALHLRLLVWMAAYGGA
mmetsp:Transcript_70084/g.197817  ORF Transcript_70084/g.197817 Transcript_70084/m.197817 type:complete len:373 (+) Transcript_70084:1040-2158(+)